jgi:tripartite-type tricarboxylate transporter receptor subunit TctC
MRLTPALSGLLLAFSMLSPALAQEFPSKPIRIIVPYGAGGVVDGLARSLSVGMKDALGQPVIVENRPGAGGVTGMQACSNAPADGHTICFTVQDSLSYNGYFYQSLPYDAENGFAPLTNLGWTNGLIVASAKSGLTSYTQLIAGAKAQPGKYNWGTWGEASQPDVQMRAVAGQAGVTFTPIPYKGQSQAAPAILSGEVDVTYMGIGMALPHIEGGRVKPLLLTGKSRSDLVPGIPTMAEVGADVGLPTYLLAAAPARVPAAAMDKLHKAIVKAAQTPSAQQFYKTFTLTFVGDTPAAFAEFVKADRANATRVFKKMGFKAGTNSAD